MSAPRLDATAPIATRDRTRPLGKICRLMVSKVLTAVLIAEMRYLLQPELRCGHTEGRGEESSRAALNAAPRIPDRNRSPRRHGCAAARSAGRRAGKGVPGKIGVRFVRHGSVILAEYAAGAVSIAKRDAVHAAVSGGSRAPFSARRPRKWGSASTTTAAASTRRRVGRPHFTVAR